MQEHNDAEYGHQTGELNFWLPLTDYKLTRTALWAESSPGQGDFHPFAVQPGEAVLFFGTLCRHHAPANPTAYTRASLDFRVGLGRFYDHGWVVPGTTHDHGRHLYECRAPLGGWPDGRRSQAADFRRLQ